MAPPSHEPEGRLPFRVALWLVPASILVHNAEEYPRIVAYANRHGWRVGEQQMGAAVILATVLPFPVTAVAARSRRGSLPLTIALAIPAALAANALGHLAQTLWFRDYSPGTATGLGINVPVAIYLYRRAVREGYLSKRQLRDAAVWGGLLLVPGALGLQALGRLVATPPGRSRRR